MNTSIDKSKELKASVKLVNQKLNFAGLVDGNPSVSIDYIPPYGDNLGYTSLELLLLSLSSCLGSAVLLFLRKMNKTIASFEIHATGLRREMHPTGFHTIQMELVVNSPDIVLPEIEKLVKMAEETYCPVWAMLKGNVKIEVKYSILQK